MVSACWMRFSPAIVMASWSVGMGASLRGARRGCSPARNKASLHASEKTVGNSVVDRAHPDGASNIQFVDTSKCFTSAGFVTSAKMYIGSASTGGRMQIYTPTGGSNYKLKAESEVFNLPTGLHTKAFANPMAVAAGDCVGWYHSGAGFIDYDSGGNAVRWNYGHHGVGTTINFDGSGARTYAYSVNKVSGF